MNALRAPVFDSVRFALAIHAARLRRGYELRQVARETGISAATLCRIERHGKVPSLPAFLTLCSWAGLERDQFLVPEPPPPTREEMDAMVRRGKEVVRRVLLELEVKK